MAKKSGISLRIEKNKIEELDNLSAVTKRDRSFLVNEAIDNYLEVHKWQLEHITESLKQAKNGKFASEHQVEKMIKKWKS